MWSLVNIPKIAHFYWGAPLLSYLRYLTVFTFNKYNPDWKIKVYYPKEKYTGGKWWSHQETDVVCEDYFGELSKIPNVEMIEVDFNSLGIGDVPEVYRSDLLRLKLLGTEGGIYSDMDILYFKPLEEAWFNSPINSKVNTIISYHPTRNHYSIGFLGASVNNDFYKFLYEEGVKRINQTKEYQWLGVIMWKTFFNTPIVITQKYPHLRVLDIQMDLCYSLDSTQIGSLYDECVPISNPKTIALHWYGGHPKTGALENKLTPYNLDTIGNTIAAVAKRALNGGNNAI